MPRSYGDDFAVVTNVDNSRAIALAREQDAFARPDGRVGGLLQVQRVEIMGRTGLSALLEYRSGRRRRFWLDDCPWPDQFTARRW
jgi:hypothetical protein